MADVSYGWWQTAVSRQLATSTLTSARLQLLHPPRSDLLHCRASCESSTGSAEGTASTRSSAAAALPFTTSAAANIHGDP